MTDEIKNTEATPSTGADLHEALSASIRAIARMSEAAMMRLAPEQAGEVIQRLKNGTGKLALFVTNDGAKVEASIALVKAEVDDVFETHLMKLHGPVLTAAVPAGEVRTVNLAKLN